MNKLALVTLMTLMMVVTLDAAKITWDENGKPIIEKSDKPIVGCNLQTLEDVNATKPCN